MQFLYGFDPLYFVILAPGIILGLYATFKVRWTFSKYSTEPNSMGLTGAQAAEILLRRSGIRGVRVELSEGGGLSDHYDPRDRSLRLSEEVYAGRSISSVAVAAHEAGHAIQHATSYHPLVLRSALVPVANFGSILSWILIFAGLALGWLAGGVEHSKYAQYTPLLLWAGIICFAAVVLFQIVTLPVEFNASARARERVVALGIVSRADEKKVAEVLNAAALTYVAAALTAILTLIYYLIRLRLVGGSNRE